MNRIGSCWSDDSYFSERFLVSFHKSCKSMNTVVPYCAHGAGKIIKHLYDYYLYGFEKKKWMRIKEDLLIRLKSQYDEMLSGYTHVKN